MTVKTAYGEASLTVGLVTLSGRSSSSAAFGSVSPVALSGYTSPWPSSRIVAVPVAGVPLALLALRVKVSGPS